MDDYCGWIPYLNPITRKFKFNYPPERYRIAEFETHTIMVEVQFNSGTQHIKVKFSKNQLDGSLITSKML